VRSVKGLWGRNIGAPMLYSVAAAARGREDKVSGPQLERAATPR
jgi:hypothetical protein